MLDAELKSKINQLWDKFWSGGISDPLVAITQMSYLIFMKRIEDEDIAREQNAQLGGKPFKSIFENNENCKWSDWTNLPANRILIHVRDNVFPFLRTLGGKDSLYSQFMKDAAFTIPNSSLLIEAVKIIDEMQIKHQNRDTKGDLFEYLLSELKTAGKNGQFRTPRHIIKMMVDIVNPKIGDVICDPACGTSGFLIATYEHILKQNTSKQFIKTDEVGHEYGLKGDKFDENQWNQLSENTLYGYDFDSTMVRISLMNLMMNGLEKPNIEQKDTLSNRYNQEKNSYNVVLANPPFTGSIDESEISREFTIKTKKTEILFLELMYNLLSSGGRCAVIVPSGILFGSSNAHKKIKQKLLGQCRMDAIISMPSGVFKPYSGVSTAVLIFTKGEPTKNVWFYNMEKDGFSLDDKRTFIDGKGDIPDIINKIKDKEDSKQSKLVTIEEIEKNDYSLSSNRYIQNFEEEEQVDIPQVLQDLKKIENERQIIDEKVKGYLKELGYDN